MWFFSSSRKRVEEVEEKAERGFSAVKEDMEKGCALISELALAIEMGCDPEDIGKTIHPHPTLGESVGMAGEVFEGVCTDLMPQKRR